MTEDGTSVLDPTDMDQVARCVSGAATIPDLQTMIDAAGFEAVSVRPKDDSEAIIEAMYGDSKEGDVLRSATIEGVKPPGKPTQ